MKISGIGDHQTIKYAAEELQKYLGRMGVTEGEIKVGLSSAFPNIRPPKVADPVLDDAIFVDVDGGNGYIAGINPRSVLLAVYRYLTELGCRWVRPSADGEYVPTRTDLPKVKLEETPSYRHRGICIEGAVSYEHVRDTIEWMPRVGMNAYFTQFREAYTFFDRWYAHDGNPLLKGHHITVEQSRKYVAQAVDEIKKRDLVYHAVGHGWTCEPFGISGLGWEQSKEEISDDIRQYFAEVNGKRELSGGVGINTNLCYGNPKARSIINEEIADYAEKHPKIDIIHFWLADGSNNQCECALCRDTRPSDLYVTMLNELDELLTKRGLNTRIVFLIYVDLMWPPEKEKIKNQKRFILMFAPISRTYSTAFKSNAELPEVPPFVRNKLEFPRSVEQNVSFLKAWQKQYTGDSFDFDYHMLCDLYNDPGCMQVSEIMNQDMRGLKDLGLGGMVSCQVQRAFFPTGLQMMTMARTLWNRDLSLDKIASDYFAGAFGPDGAYCRVYMEQLTELFDPYYQRGDKPQVDETAAVNFSKIPQVIAEFMPVIEHNMKIKDPCQAKSWFYVKHHAEICAMRAKALEAIARDDKKTAHEIWEKAKKYILEHEMDLHHVLDVMMFTGVAGGKFPSGE